MIGLTLPIPPSANRYWRVGRGGHVYVSEEAAAYKDNARWLVSKIGTGIMQGNLVVTIRVFRARKSGDLDNYIKVLLDALRGACYMDDKQVVEIHAYRDDDRLAPRVEVSISAENTARRWDASEKYLDASGWPPGTGGE
jgi:Holliday junction resolvase RusA-like endonuclease